ncbi:MAG: T9SS type A sorting domain-containing protein [Bacteroidales bacterium]|nr:T9SS type A sorting domain-containing protein [Bacteroidales bacterium]
MKQHFLIFILFTALSTAKAQTNPVPFDLSTGDYSLTEWAVSSSAGTYPNNIIFHRFNNVSPDTSTMAAGDWICGYNLASRARIIGKDINGFSFLNTSSAQYDNCSTGSASLNTYVGEAVLALNTLNRDSIMIEWKGIMHSALTYVPGTTGQNRFFSIQLQYRIGDAGNFYSLSQPNIFSSDSTPTLYKQKNHTDIIGPVLLPDSCNNKPLIQLRWLYYQNVTGYGSRPELGVDDIFVTSINSGTTDIFKKNVSKVLNIIPNPSNGVFKITSEETISNIIIYDIMGKIIFNQTQSGNYFHIDISSFPKGAYFVKIKFEKNGERVVKKIIMK